MLRGQHNKVLLGLHEWASPTVISWPMLCHAWSIAQVALSWQPAASTRKMAAYRLRAVQSRSASNHIDQSGLGNRIVKEGRHCAAGCVC